jgi:protein-S-isoprenylcysteine O-methyltransferase Ste14
MSGGASNQRLIVPPAPIVTRRVVWIRPKTRRATKMSVACVVFAAVLFAASVKAPSWPKTAMWVAAVVAIAIAIVLGLRAAVARKSEPPVMKVTTHVDHSAGYRGVIY